MKFINYYHEENIPHNLCSDLSKLADSVHRWEMNNLADNPEYSSKVKELKAGISAWMKQQGDDGHLTGEGIKYFKTKSAN